MIFGVLTSNSRVHCNRSFLAYPLRHQIYFRSTKLSSNSVIFRFSVVLANINIFSVPPLTSFVSLASISRLQDSRLKLGLGGPENDVNARIGFNQFAHLSHFEAVGSVLSCQRSFSDTLRHPPPPPCRKSEEEVHGAQKDRGRCV